MDLSSYLPLLDPSMVQALVGVLLVVVMLHVILGGCAYGVMLERKLSSWMQDRVGPNRVGPRGLFQPLADGLKFMMKEDYNPAGVDRALFILAPAFIVVPAFIGFVIMPWGGEVNITAVVQFFGLAQAGVEYPVRLIAADINVGVVYLLATAGLGVYGVALGGWASNSKFSFLGGLRAGAQMISYEIPMGLTLLCVVLAAGSFTPYAIVNAQLEGQWNLVQQPLAAIIFYTCLLAEANRAPFDLAEAESELVGGYHTEYSSMKFALYFLGEYFHLITGSAFFVMLFLGGWSLNPFTDYDLPFAATPLIALLQISVVVAKITFMVGFAMAIRWTIPRFRFDQLMRLSWEGLIPASLILVLMVAFAIYFDAVRYLWVGSIICALLIYVFHWIMPSSLDSNKRIRMIGSRFSPVTDGEGTLAGRPAVALDDRAMPDPRQGPISIH
ncbi:MAG: NADH-quinone oxidoreductase subunit H [Phycisphaerales bacterium]|nr:NADH-quinone oxidoreductase subunit H [Phycisphaerales bacterium]